jgi:hypothetical protein
MSLELLEKENKKLSEALASGKTNECAQIVFRMRSIIGTNTSAIPSKMKELFGLSYIFGLGELNPGVKSNHTTTALLMFRNEILFAMPDSPNRKKFLNAIDMQMMNIQNAMDVLENSDDDKGISNLMRVTTNALSFLTVYVYNGYGIVDIDGYRSKDITSVTNKEN